MAPNTQLIDPILPFVHQVEESLTSLSDDRKQLLDGVVDYVVLQRRNGNEAKLVFICTHNSRRSHLAHVWCQVAATHFNVPGIMAYSGGTEETACNIRTVHSFRRSGLSVVASTENENPIYWIQYSDQHPPIRAYSKVYSDGENPSANFAAMMCCAQVDEQCPLVVGADTKFSLQYVDPKVADDTPEESKIYDDRSLQIAREMFYVMSEVSNRI